MAGTAGALVIGIGEVRAQDAPSADVPLAMLGDDVTALGPFLRIEPDGRTLIGARDPDCGEGTRTSLPRIIADELDADWRQVIVLPLGPKVVNENGNARWRYGRQLSGESASIPAAWNDLRQAGALARWLLLQAAVRRSGVAASQLRCRDGRISAPNGKSYSYGELVKDAAQQAPPQTPPPLKVPADYRYIGHGAGDVDAHAIVTGQQRYSSDRFDGDPLIAVVLHCPYVQGKLDRIDTEAALKVPGVKQVLPLEPEPHQTLGNTPLAPSVAVLAVDTWSALRGRDALKVMWKQTGREDESTEALFKQAHALLDSDAEPTTHVRSDGDIDAAFKHARTKIEQVYVQPFVAHALAETMTCIARVENDQAHLVIPTQAPQQALSLVQRLTGLTPQQITIEVPRVGGGFGRRIDQDFVAEAVMLAKAAGQPVKLYWSREQDLRNDPYRPAAVHKLSAALDRHHRIIGWRMHKASPSMLTGRGVSADRLWTSEMERDALPAGLVENYQSSWWGLDSGLPRGETRADAHTVNTFAEQAFLDEIAKATRQDPLDLRLKLLGDSDRSLPYSGRGGAIDTARLRKVLTLAADAIDWKKHRTNGHGLGIAYAYIYGAYCAHAFEVSVRSAKLVIHRVVCAVDVGRAVNPTGLEAQVIGATMDGISTTLGQAISVDQGQVQQHNFKDYPMSRMAHSPRDMQVIVVPSEAAPMGATGIAMPSAGPALANAVYAATTVRIHRLPLLPELMRLL
nr:molybdopterin cofactor-binding domain-containing protein [Oleiagrimonas sp. C23AA]